MYEDAIVNPFEPEARPVNIVPIANGYLVCAYRGNRYEQWYCIDTQEIVEKLDKFL